MKILLVEDEPTIRETVADELGKWGFEVWASTNFEHILNDFLAQSPQLVLLDINLPYFDGFYWCRKIREVSKVPIIFLSSRDNPMDMVMAMNMGGDDFVQKPFYTDVLVAKIQALMRRTYSYTQTETNVVEYEGVVLNLQSGEVTYHNQILELTKNEFKILQILMQNIGSIVSRDNIMRKLWENESFVDDNTLTVNVARVRKKLAELGKEEFIHTKKGQGYIIT
ncbi:TPA: response regulator transcription factor [Bacillus anthracis]|uniref:response regulator transcription factor n=1 Tax=Bacillus cereus group TaxID=86661 RepID=UPI0001DBF52D|nr:MULTISPECIES: response regulator transcription factor [Bacillus cereus group]HDR4492968.1 response regulator transcription factor [Bacillus cereus biovar anthracis]ADK07651.1 putative two-component response regulator [Bacillus cereus biovar anthracis str. CI]TXS03876.1 DNA-binding response regulator [Bacillus sp. SH7-1]HDR6228125.1 response regulator transcription factor [Bacillus cereus biovar anthracis]HDR6234446.1 response regulator transcription factor [Bacillus cereus biovar anthracis]